MSARQAQQGFTLVEVLVALTLMALVSLISWRGLEALQKTGERLDERAEETLSLVRVLGQLERDILLRAGPDIFPVSAPMTSGTINDAVPTMPPGMSWDSDAGLSLVRAAGDGRWQQLRWYLHDGQLWRAVGAPSHLLPLPPVEAGMVVLEGVHAFSLRTWRAGEGWVAQATNTDRQAGAPTPVRSATVPRGLEISLYRQEPNDINPYRKVVLLQ